MRRSGRFERRLVLALVLFSLIPSLLVVGLGTFLLRDAATLQSTPVGWERLAESGRLLLELAEASGDPAMGLAAAEHREELTIAVQQAQRWGYLNRRALEVLPWAAITFLAILSLLAIRFARGIARDLSRPIAELVGWAGRVARGEPLPEQVGEARGETGEFLTLRESFRGMAREIAISREREIEAAKVRASVSLARGVAHELKNALTPLTLAIRTLRRQHPLTGGEREPLDVIEAESKRLETLARSFSQFARPPEGTRSRIDLHELLAYLAGTYLPRNVQVRLETPERLPPVNGYYDALSRAFANLLLNAVEAIGDAAGNLDIQVSRVGEGEIQVRIADSGPGLPPDRTARIWDPDFTTKAQGTGLGLALVRQTVLAHGGRVSATNRPEGGAAFTVVLPADNSPADIEERVELSTRA